MDNKVEPVVLLLPHLQIEAAVPEQEIIEDICVDGQVYAQQKFSAVPHPPLKEDKGGQKESSPL
jgi:hypothetical protein